MVSIPGGTFLMGSVFGEKDELPMHNVIISPFKMSATVITVGQFSTFVNETGYLTEAERGDGAFVSIGITNVVKRYDANWGNPYMVQGNNHPVVCVSWNDANAFCYWIQLKIGGEVRLPTEAEWEYACRAGTTTEYYSGDSESDLACVGWYEKNCNNKFHRNHPVGEKASNSWGLYDMHGNVCEWCHDWYGPYKKSRLKDPTGPTSGTERVVRGGSHFNSSCFCRSATREKAEPQDGADDIGFRIVHRP